ncbi:MAG: hypothetical protein KJ066_12700 [Acidobacteria bacterium]|nr:hypothetical protein [Acidobacteriota bacterium]
MIYGAGGFDRVSEAVVEDRDTWSDDPAFLLAYDESGESLIDPRVAGGKVVRDLKPSPSAMHQFHDRIAAAAERGGLSPVEWLATRRSMDTAAAFGSEVVQDNNGRTKPLALHFTAGQQSFLDAAAKLQQGITADHVREALLGPWTGSSKLPSMSWDSTITRMYALRATDPSGEKRGSTPGADWLAFIGLGVLLVVPRGRRLVTAGVRGGWKDGEFSWPMWSVPLSLPVVRALLLTPTLPRLPAAERAARGIATVFSSAIMRYDPGGYGGFSPARVE